MGKSTLIADFIKAHPEYSTVIEPYYHLQNQKEIELSLEPTIESLVEQLDQSIEDLNQHASKTNVIFDRCPIDFIAYALCILQNDDVNIHDTEISERFPEVKKALNNLDFIFFLPMTKEHIIEYPEENPTYRRAADSAFKKIYRDDVCDIFPRYGHPKIIELWGDRLTRVKKLESCLFSVL
ncbi:MAG: AAA family ATPase [Proteobacteria bacterium]|nr:AAA family ATPase [Pseudomonadota bacterium]